MSHIDAMYRFQETFPIGSFHFLIEHDINIAFQKKIFVFLHIIDDSMYYSERICQFTFLIFYKDAIQNEFSFAQTNQIFS